MTKSELEEYRRMRKIYNRSGRRGFSEEVFPRFRAQTEEVRAWVHTLRGAEFCIAYWYYYKGLSSEAVSLHVCYSERQVRRIRRRIMEELDD